VAAGLGAAGHAAGHAGVDRHEDGAEQREERRHAQVGGHLVQQGAAVVAAVDVVAPAAGPVRAGARVAGVEAVGHGGVCVSVDLRGVGDTRVERVKVGGKESIDDEGDDGCGRCDKQIAD
jgi:hypothetical protein